MNIKNLSIKDTLKIKDMALLSVYRYSLKLIKTYPSIKRDELKEVLIIGKIFKKYKIKNTRVQRKSKSYK
mgnify:CR=1 FL=1